MNKQVGWALLFLFSIALNNPVLPAISKPSRAEHSTSSNHKRQVQNASIGREVHSETRRRFKKKHQKVHKKLEGIKLPKGKLLASIVLLVLSIVFFALAGVTVLGILFNALGSLAIIASLVFFIFWLNDKSKQAKAATTG